MAPGPGTAWDGRARDWRQGKGGTPAARRAGPHRQSAQSRAAAPLDPVQEQGDKRDRHPRQRRAA
jgi:hypothetical protein